MSNEPKMIKRTVVTTTEEFEHVDPDLDTLDVDSDDPDDTDDGEDERGGKRAQSKKAR